ncbi:MAG TPA: pirin family protein [Pyrinomonadaceae bacterium]|nr:pirin family protein [Pyrinomonadaceae bacterium]
MITVRRADERGKTRTSWLDSRHTFSFNNYYDPRQMGFRSLRVINEDFVAPGAGFPEHAHSDMEIITYVLRGGLAHKDSTGAAAVLYPGEVQRMSAGTGIAHSEFNAARDEESHFLQIWLLPERRGLEPGYEQRAFPEEARRDKLRLVVSRESRDGALKIHQDAEVYDAALSEGAEVTHELRAGRHAWVQVASGAVELNGVALRAGDGAAASEEESLVIRASEPSSVILFDLA